MSIEKKVSDLFPTLLDKINEYNRTPEKGFGPNIFLPETKITIQKKERCLSLHSPKSKKLSNFKILPNQSDPKTIKNLVEKLQFSTRSVMGFGIENFHSTKTLQNSISSISFTKSKRFSFSKNEKNNENKTNDNNPLKSTISQRSTGMGFGNRITLPFHVLRIAAQNPAPNKYLISSPFDPTNNEIKKFKNPKGKSFGLSFKYYENVYANNLISGNSKTIKENPGPGTYDFNSEGSKFKNNIKNRKKIINLSILKTKNEEDYKIYTPNNKLVQSMRFSTMTFSKSKRNMYESNNSPGPGHYEFNDSLFKEKKKKFQKIKKNNI